MPEATASQFTEAAHSSVNFKQPRRVPAWLMSVGLHTFLLVAVALLSDSGPRAPSIEPARTAGIALVHRTQADATYFSESDAATMSETMASLSADFAGQPSPLAAMPIAPAIELPSATGAADGIGTAQVLPGAIGFTTGIEGAQRVPGGQARTQLFGAEGTGTKFVYVFDRSASMAGFQGRPMTAARGELLTSLNDLDSVHQFQIVFYNEAPAVFNPDRPRPPSILFASDDNKKLAKGFIESINPSGGTRHLEALKLAIGMKPDVIFFLTDAAEPQLSPGELAEIRRRNESQATIHSIEFGSGPFPGGDNFLVRLARQNNGQHVYVDITRLP